MKTTLNLPDELMREVKVRAAREDRKLQDLLAELIQRGLAQKDQTPDRIVHRVHLPLVQCRHEALPDRELTPDRVAAILLDDEALDPLR